MRPLIPFLLLLPLAAQGFQISQWDIITRTGSGAGAANALKVSELTEETAPTTGDWILCEESGGALRKCDFGDIDHDDLTNFVANEHIDWTAASSNFSTSGTAATGNLTVTGNIAATTYETGVSAAELGYLDGVTSAIQTQIDAKEGTLTNSAGLASALSDETGTGVVVFGTSPIFTTQVTLTPQATPTTDADGEIAVDIDAWATGRDAIEFFDSTASTYLIGVLASDTPSDGQVPQWNTGGTITWEAAGGGMTSWTLAGDAGSPQTVSDGNTATFAGDGAGIDTSAGATDTLTISFVPADAEAGLEAVLDLQDLQGAVTDAQVPDTITINLAATATALAANGANCSAGSYPLGVDASGAAESCTAAHSTIDSDYADETVTSDWTLTGDNAVWLLAQGESYTTGASNPGTCTTGAFFFNSTTNTWYRCITTDEWTQISTAGWDRTNGNETLVFGDLGVVGHMAVGNFDSYIDRDVDTGAILVKDYQNHTSDFAIGISSTVVWEPDAGTSSLILYDSYGQIDGSNAITLGAIISYASNPALGGSGSFTVTDIKHFDVEDLIDNAASGAATNQYGLYVADLTTATNNYGIFVETAGDGTAGPDSRFGGDVTVTHSASPTITAQDTTNSVIAVQQAGDDGAVFGTTSSHPLWLYAGGLAATFGTDLSLTLAGDLDLQTNFADFGDGTMQIPNGTTLPATCAVGDQFMDTDATSGQRHYLCESTNTWALQGDGGGTETNDLETDGAAGIAADEIYIGTGAGTGVYRKISAFTEETAPAAGDFLFGEESGGNSRKFDIGDLPNGLVYLACALSDTTTDLTAGTDKCYVPVPKAFTIDTTVNNGAYCSVTTAPTTTGIVVDVHESTTGLSAGGTTIMTTNKIAIDATETKSWDAGTAPGVTDTAIAGSSTLVFDLDQIGSGTAGKNLVCGVVGSFDL